MELFELFKTILKKGPATKQSRDDKEKEAQTTKEHFLQTLQELKYMGYISQTKQSTFIFKKNYFGKPKHGRHTTKTEQQLE